MLTPVLIVCYLRPENLEILLNSKSMDYRRIYIFIDGYSQGVSELHEEVINIANKYSKIKNVFVRVEDYNIGAQAAVLEAVTWALGLEHNVIVLEDDSTLNENSLRYFDRNQYLLENGSIKILSGRSINGLSTLIDNSGQKLFVASFPLTNGWSVNRDSWKLLTVTAKRMEILGAIFRLIYKQIYTFNVFCFFAAGYYRFRNKIGKTGWDSMIAFNFIIFNYKCIIPSVNVIGNNGCDNVASNTTYQNEEIKEDFIELGNFNDNFILMRDRDLEKKVDSLITKEIYEVKKYHILSPLKAIIEKIAF